MENRGRVLDLFDAEHGDDDPLAVFDSALSRDEIEEIEPERDYSVLKRSVAEINKPRPRAALDRAAEAEPERPPRIGRAVVLEAAGVVMPASIGDWPRGVPERSPERTCESDGGWERQSSFSLSSRMYMERSAVAIARRESRWTPTKNVPRDAATSAKIAVANITSRRVNPCLWRTSVTAPSPCCRARPAPRGLRPKACGAGTPVPIPRRRLRP